MRPRAYEPADWIDELANQPPEDRPWLAMEQHVRGGMDKATCLAVGRKLADYLRGRFRRLGLDSDFVTEFDLQDGRPTRDSVAGMLFHCKWIEHTRGQGEWNPPAWFWWGWEDAPTWAKK